MEAGNAQPFFPQHHEGSDECIPLMDDLKPEAAGSSTALNVRLFLTYPASKGVGTFFIGDCTLVSRLNPGIHIVLNVLSTAFLGAGNYCMQILVAPSLSEVDRAHRDGVSLDIGVHSVHNLRYIGAERRMGWAAIGIVASMLHLVCVELGKFGSFIIPVAVVTEDFTSAGDDWNLTQPNQAEAFVPNGPTVGSLQLSANHFTEVNASECIQTYIHPLDQTQELVVVTNISSLATFNHSSLLQGFVTPSVASNWECSGSWICSAHPVGHDNCSSQYAKTFEDNWVLNVNITPYSGVAFAKVQHCLVGTSADKDSRCGFHYSKAICILVCVLTIIEASFIGVVAATHRSDTVVLVGDAIASFLKRGAGPPNLGNAKADGGKKSKSRTARSNTDEWANSKPTWFHAVGLRHWLVTGSLLIAGILLALSLLIVCLTSLKRRDLPISMSAIWADGIGKAQGYNLVGSLLKGSNLSSIELVGHVLFVNMFQVLLSFLYLFYNNVLTCQLAADEMIRFLREKKALRVSGPQNLSQRSSYFLSLPWLYAIPQMLAFVLLHWLISESVFIVETTAYGPGPDGRRIPEYDSSRVAFSTLGIFFTTILAFAIVAGLFANSIRRYNGVPKDLPAMATNSNALEILCRRPTEDNDAYLYPIRLGVVPGPLAPGTSGRLVFSSYVDMVTPRDGETYERPVWNDRSRKGRDKLWQLCSNIMLKVRSILKRK